MTKPLANRMAEYAQQLRFTDLPDLPLSEIEVHLREGPRIRRGRT